MLRKTILIFTLLATSCKSGGNFDQPPAIRYGEDACDECFMLINEARYAAAFMTNDGQSKRFDDIGCLLIYQKKHHDGVAFFWVADYGTQKWLDADRALFFETDSIQTPMGFGIVAFESEKIAGNFIPPTNQEPSLKFFQLLEKTEDLYNNSTRL